MHFIHCSLSQPGDALSNPSTFENGLFLFSLSSLTSSAHHSPLFIFVRECIWQGGRPAFISQDISACISVSEEIYYILVRMATRGMICSQLLSWGARGRLRCYNVALRWERAVLKDENKKSDICFEMWKKIPVYHRRFWILDWSDTVTYHGLLLLFVLLLFVFSVFTTLEGNSPWCRTHFFWLSGPGCDLKLHRSHIDWVKVMMRDDEGCSWRRVEKNEKKICDKDPVMQKIVWELSKVLILLSPQTKSLLLHSCKCYLVSINTGQTEVPTMFDYCRNSGNVVELFVSPMNAKQNSTIKQL